MAHVARQRFTFAEYAVLEAMSTVKHEFYRGEVWAMAGGTPEHSAIAVNIATLLNNQLREQPCRVFSSDLRIRVKATGLATYPDLSVVCGKLEIDPEDPEHVSVINPRVLVEVLCASTESYDRGQKLDHYKQIDSLAEVVLVAQGERRIEIAHREPDGWTLTRIENDVHAVAELPSIGCNLPLAEVYRNPLS